MACAYPVPLTYEARAVAVAREKRPNAAGRIGTTIIDSATMGQHDAT